MDKNKNDPLSSLVVDDAAAFDRQKVADFLKPFIILDRGSKQISFLPAFEKIKTNPEKIEVILMASKVKFLVFNEPEGMIPSEIINLQIIPEGSVKTALKKLSDDKQIKKDDSGRYFIPNYKINELISKNSAYTKQ